MHIASIARAELALFVLYFRVLPPTFTELTSLSSDALKALETMELLFHGQAF